MKGTNYKKNSLKTNVGGNTLDNKPKQKVLLPTLKDQQRYVVYRILKTLPMSQVMFSKDFGILHNEIISKCNNTLGIFDGGNAGLMGVKYNADKMSGVIRVDNKYVDKLKVCFGLIKELKEFTGQSITVDCVYVSGMLNKAVDKMNA
ncbi:MAG: Rpp14/Pop5 family protein [Candidatus Woesearchaeota archaeon]